MSSDYYGAVAGALTDEGEAIEAAFLAWLDEYTRREAPTFHDQLRDAFAAGYAASPGALEAVLALHVQDTTWGAGLEGGRFDYCSTCSGHPAWPCPEVAAISQRAAAARCPDCQGTGIVYVETDCGGCSGYPGIAHEPACGVEPCPRGCEVPSTATKRKD